MTAKRRTSIVLVGLVLVLSLVLAYCIPTPTPTPTPTPVPPGQISFDCQQGPAYQIQQPLPTNPYFVLGQVILTGSPQDLQRMVADLDQQGIKLELFEGCQFAGLGLLPPAQAPAEFPKEPGPEAGGPNPFYDAQKGQMNVAGDVLAINLYQIGSGHSVEDAVSAVADIRQQNPDLAAYADPNYLTGHLTSSPCGNPFSVEGSPFSVEGSPFSVEGSPAGGQGLSAEAPDFWEQWAFDEIGLLPPPQREKGTLGGDVQVAIFDTSPFKLSRDPGDGMQPFTTGYSSFDLNIHHPFALHPLAPSGTLSPVIDEKDHGLFVAGLVHAVAPDSTIDLYRVLDDNGCGDLYQLVRAVEAYAAQLGRSEGRKAVINFSLGIQKPRRLPAGEAGAQAMAVIEAQGEAAVSAYRMAQADDTLEALDSALRLAYQSGAVIVAASGNASVRDPNAPGSGKLKVLDSNLPAAYSFVLGASASGPRAQPACYANTGDVVAPGGQAGFDDSNDGNPDTVPHCVAQAQDCVGQGPGCPTGVVSLTTSGSTGYSYWVGTSFAAPLTSGLAALFYQGGAQNSVYGQVSSSTAPAVIDPTLAKRGLIHIP